MEDKLKILELIRDGKVNPEQGLELLETIGEGGNQKIVDDFVAHHGNRGQARYLRITSLSRKGNEHSFNIPLSVVKFAHNLFPRLKFMVNCNQLDLEELMERVYSEETGIIYEDENEKVVFELI